MDGLFDEKRVYTIGEIAGALRVSPVSVIRAVHKGRLKALRVGGQWRVPGREVLRYLYVETKESLARRHARVPH